MGGLLDYVRTVTYTRKRFLLTGAAVLAVYMIALIPAIHRAQSVEELIPLYRVLWVGALLVYTLLHAGRLRDIGHPGYWAFATISLPMLLANFAQNNGLEILELVIGVWSVVWFLYLVVRPSVANGALAS